MCTIFNIPIINNKYILIIYIILILFQSSYSQCTHDGSTLVIGSNITWNTNMTISGNVYVNGGFKLTITSTITFMPGAELTVAQNAELLVDGGTLQPNSSCNSYWRGISVLGDYTQIQDKVGGVRAQGYVEIINNATIKGAEAGVALTDRVTGNTAGGVLIADKANFVDNQIGVVYAKYPFFGSGITVNNLSKIHLSNFYYSNLMPPYVSAFFPYPIGILADGVRGLEIRGCHFRSQTYAGSYGGGPMGIYTGSSSINVKPYCASVACSTPVPNKFENLRRGIFCWIGNDKSVVINDNEFVDCYDAIELLDLDNPVVLGNYIEMRQTTSQEIILSNISSGISVILADGYRVEENEILALHFSTRSCGINVNQCGIEENQVYKNTMTGFQEYWAFHSLAAARSWNTNAGPGPIIEGLQWICNVFNENNQDIAVGPISSNGMRLVQGDLLTRGSVENQFNHSVFIYYNLLNDGSNSPLTYIHSGGNTEPFVTTNVTSIPSIAFTTCKSKRVTEEIDPELERSNNSEVYSLNSVFYELIPQMSSSRETIFSLIDNGNTNNLLMLVNNVTNSSSALDVFNTLSSVSPYISRQVCKAIIKSSFFSEDQVLGILISNPDATKSELFLQFLTENANFQVTNVHLQSIRSTWEIETELTNLIMIAAKISSDVSDAANRLLTYYKSQDLFEANAILEIYDLWPSLRYKYSYLDYLVEQGDFEGGRNYIQNLRTRFNLTCIEESELSNYGSWIDLVENQFNSSLSWQNLGVENLQPLYEIANSSTGKASRKARQVLCFHYNVCDLPDPVICEDVESYNFENNSFIDITHEKTRNLNSIKVYPSPATNFINLDLGELKSLANLSIQISDAVGKLVFSSKVSENIQQFNINSLVSGVYLVKVLSNDTVFHQQPLLIQQQK